jgi:hypothetical protein
MARNMATEYPRSDHCGAVLGSRIRTVLQAADLQANAADDNVPLPNLAITLHRRINQPKSAVTCY